ncbi:MAG TPA: hypothetical protein VHJ83_13390, partial [Micromonosporaceae bacterium]|nr:hypothetical protein [Micromonosporaceae bacterium]
MSLFGADVVPALPVDLEGLLAGPGQVVRMGGTARISIVVDESWRARTLLAEFARRGLAATGERTTASAANGAVGPPAGTAAVTPDGGDGSDDETGTGAGAEPSAETGA